MLTEFAESPEAERFHRAALAMTTIHVLPVPERQRIARRLIAVGAIALEDRGVVIEIAKPRARSDTGRVFRLEAEDFHARADRAVVMLAELLTLIGERS
jgi:hypothetical protein